MSEEGPFPLVALAEAVEVLDHLRVPVNSDERAKRPGPIPYYGANGQQGWIDEPLFNEPLVLLAEDGGNFDEYATRPIAYRVDGPSWVNNHAHVVRALGHMDQDFVFWSLVHRDIRRYIAGGTRSKLTQAELRSIEIEEPPLPEQRKIAEILDTVDAAIRKTEQILAKLEQVKQGLLHDLLTRGIDDNGELRDPVRHPEQFQDSPLGRIPRGWEFRSLQELGEIGSGTTPSRRQESRYFGEGHLWAKTMDLNEDLLIETEEQVSEAALRETSLSLRPPGTLLIAMYGGWQQIGRTALLAQTSCTNQAISTLELRCEDVVPEYLLRALQHGRPRWKEVAASTRKDPNITKSDVKRFRVPVPPPSEQRLIVRSLNAQRDRALNEDDSLRKLRALRQGLMDDLLTGRVRVTPLLEDTPE